MKAKSGEVGTKVAPLVHHRPTATPKASAKPDGTSKPEAAAGKSKPEEVKKQEKEERAQFKPRQIPLSAKAVGLIFVITDYLLLFVEGL